MTPKSDDKILYIIMGIIGYVFCIFVSLHLGTVMYRNEGLDLINSIGFALTSMSENPFDIVLGFATFKSCGIMTVVYIIVVLFIIIESEQNKRDMAGKETGSSRFATDADRKKYNKTFNAPYGDVKNDGKENVYFANDVALGMDGRKTKRNLNAIVMGGSGSGKSRYFVKPNLLCANSSFVVTDPSGELVRSTGKFLEDQGYKIKVFNLVDMKHSYSYNPFNYIRDDLGVVSMVNCLIKNTTPPGKGGGDPFWEKSETALLQALIFYLRECARPEQQNFTSVMKLLRAAEVDENNLNKKSDLDRLFDNLAKKNPNSIALKQYRTFKMGSGKTLKSILISCSVRLTVFNMREIEDLTGTDSIDLAGIGREKQALFVVLPQADDTYNFLASLMYSQLYETLYFQAENEWPNSYLIKNGNEVLETILKISGSDFDNKGKYDAKEKAEELLKELKKAKIEKDKKEEKYYIKYSKYNERARENKIVIKKFATKEMAEEFKHAISKAEIKRGAPFLPVHVRFLLDEFANIGQIPEFDKKMATMRKYEISSSVILQNLAQLKEIYDKKTEAILGNADTLLFLGSPEPETCKYISERLGNATITTRDRSRSRGGRGSSNLSYKQSKRELMTAEEVSRMPDTDCIVFIRGQHPFYGPKLDYIKHKNYKYTGDCDGKNIYDIKIHVSNNKPDNTETSLIEKETKQEKAKQNLAKTSDIMEPNMDLLKGLNITKPDQIKNVLKSDYSEPEINIRRSYKENKQEPKIDISKSQTEMWTYN